MKDEAFKTCPTCRHEWPALEGFLSDPALDLAGYQVHFYDLKGGLFFFTHRQQSCLTTLAIPVKDFLSLNDRPLLSERDKTLCSQSEFCVRHGEPGSRPVKCECAWVHSILKAIREWPKAAL